MKPARQALNAIIIASALLLSASAASAQQTCWPRDHALDQLKKQHHERVFGRGLSADGKAMFELFVSKLGAWTVMVSDPNGQSCVVAIGESWHDVKPLVGDPA